MKPKNIILCILLSAILFTFTACSQSLKCEGTTRKYKMKAFIFFTTSSEAKNHIDCGVKG